MSKLHWTITTSTLQSKHVTPEHLRPLCCFSPVTSDNNMRQYELGRWHFTLCHILCKLFFESRMRHEIVSTHTSQERFGWNVTSRDTIISMSSAGMLRMTERAGVRTWDLLCETPTRGNSTRRHVWGRFHRIVSNTFSELIPITGADV